MECPFKFGASNVRKWLCKLAAIVSCLGLSSTACAAEALVTAVPTAWRLQNYVGGNVVVWYTGVTACSSGGLIMPSGSTAEEKNRFWSLIMTAKAAAKPVLVYYDNVNCNISSFGYLEGG